MTGVSGAAPEVEDFRALARSSPWRWRTLRFTASWTGPWAGEPVRAWIERPNRIRVESLSGQVRLDEVQQVGPSTGFAVAFSPGEMAQDPRLADPAHRATVVAELRRDAEARHRDEAARRLASTVVDEAGLVRRRLTDRFAHDAPMYQSYHWVAMLDPLELADGQPDEDDPEALAAHTAGAPPPHGTTISELRAVEHEGRPAWEAILQTTPVYDPRCSCCPLLPGEVADGYEDRRSREGAYAEAYRVRLDVGTGICVLTEEIGGAEAGAGHRLRIEAAGERWGSEKPPWRRR